MNLYINVYGQKLLFCSTTHSISGMGLVSVLRSIAGNAKNPQETIYAAQKAIRFITSPKMIGVIDVLDMLRQFESDSVIAYLIGHIEMFIQVINASVDGFILMVASEFNEGGDDEGKLETIEWLLCDLLDIDDAESHIDIEKKQLLYKAHKYILSSISFGSINCMAGVIEAMRGQYWDSNIAMEVK
jgi:hypothetical protein